MPCSTASTLGGMTTDPINDDLASINAALQAASDHLDAVSARYGVSEGQLLVVSKEDEDALAAIDEMREAQRRLSAFLEHQLAVE